MPLYSFEEAGGEQVLLFFHMADVPKLGETVERDGRPLTRIPDLPGQPVVESYRFKAWSQRHWAKGAEAYDEHGTPCFTSKKAIQRYIDTQHALVDRDGRGEQGGEYVGYDGKTTI